MKSNIILSGTSQSSAYTRARLSHANFDNLPDAAFVSLPTVCTLLDCSPATVWRRVKTGQLIKPHRIGLRTTRWNVGELRKALASVMNHSVE